jgi:hypothetical protein
MPFGSVHFGPQLHALSAQSFGWHGTEACAGGGSTGAPSGLMHVTLPVTGLTSATWHFAGAGCFALSPHAALAHAITPSSSVAIIVFIVVSTFDSISQSHRQLS